MPNIKKEVQPCRSLQEKQVMASLRLYTMVVFQAWRLVTLATTNEALTTENARLSLHAGKRSESIWQMSKAELVETARRELGMSLQKAAGQTALMLREQLRRARQMSETVEDPLMQVPKGLEKMKLEELQEIHKERNLPQTDRMTRASIILQIRDDVSQRYTISQMGLPPNMKHPQNAGQKEEESDQEMEQARSSTRVKRETKKQ